MRKNVFTKVLYEKRRPILLWSATVFIMNIALAFLFPPLRDTMGEVATTIPAGLEKWFGEAEVWQTYTGYAGQELFGQMAIVLIIMAILFGSSFLAGYEKNGTLLTLLARPVSRQKVYLQKYAAFVVSLLVVSLAYYAGAVVGGWALGESVDYWIFAECMLMVTLLSLALGSIAYAIGGVTGKSGTAGVVVGFYAVIAYLLASLSMAADVVDKLSYGSLFRYASAPDVIANGLNVGHITLLLAVAIVAVLAAMVVFVRRDLSTR